MSSIFSLIIFVIIFFIYLHLIDQYKTSNDLELYEMDYTNNNDLNETCNIKQPVVFNYNHVNDDFYQTITNETLENIKDNLIITDEKLEQFMLECSSACVLLHNDSKNHYYTENNELFVYESNLQNVYEKNDYFLKPPFTVKTKYDLHIATNNATTPLKYHTYQRHFISVHSGKIRVKLVPPKFKKYMEEIKDYDNYVFYSPIHLWDIQKKYAHIPDKIQILEFDINPGNILYIPPFWWYSIQFIYEDETPCLCTSITYITAMNILANIKNYFLYFIQQSNTQVVNARTITNEPPKEVDENTEPNNTEETEESHEEQNILHETKDSTLINKNSDI